MHEELKEKFLCYRCVGEAYLRAEIEHEGQLRRCAYCGHKGRCYTVGEMAERTEDVFEQHYVRTSDQPNSWQQTLLSDRESEYDWERDGEAVVYAIANAADMPEEAAGDIQAILEEEHGDFDSALMGMETEFCGDSYYEERSVDDERWLEDWRSFERSFKTEARFFSRTAAQHLGSVFRGIDAMSTIDGKPVLIEAGPDTPMSIIFRARTFQSDDRLCAALCRPDRELGSPPARLASEGRMNARGISAFYGANESRVAIAEIRPPVGSQVAVASFEIIRPLRLVDLAAVSEVSERGSLFDAKFGERLERAMFLQSLSQRMTRPVMPDDEALEYLPTQAIADFLATESKIAVDGMVFPSVQAVGNALNVVLFHKAARVAPIEVAHGTEIEASTGEMYEEGWEREYTVIERVPSTPEKDEAGLGRVGPTNVAAMLRGRRARPDSDWREPTLRINLNSIKVHVVRGVEFDTSEHDVSRMQFGKHELDVEPIRAVSPFVGDDVDLKI